MSSPTNIDLDVLRTMPLPMPEGDTDKNARGRVLVVGGSRRVPGAVVLSGMAALRAGAGKIQLAVPGSLTPAIGFTALEAGLFPLHESSEGEPLPLPAEELVEIARQVDAVLIGPGVMSAAAGGQLVRFLLKRVVGPVYVIDALALCDLWDESTLLQSHSGRIVLTPHTGEMAQLSRQKKSSVEADPMAVAQAAAARLGCCVVLKGSTTYIANPSRATHVHAGGVVGLATAGSGDVLAGLIAGIAARGVAPVTAAVWGVFLHGRAGRRLTDSIGKVGFIARELVDEIPALLDAVQASFNTC